MSESDARYLKIVLDPIRVSADYEPKFGKGNKAGGYSLDEFQTLYRSDPFYSWFGLDNPLLYAAHKAAGGMTSVYRQIGIGCEKLFRAILRDSFGLTEMDISWSYKVPRSSGGSRTMYLDGRVGLDNLKNEAQRVRFQEWMTESCKLVGVDKNVSSSLKGTVFEIRQGYKSKDSKRQNADIANAAAAYVEAYFPCAVLLSMQIDSSIHLRYKAAKWSILTGTCRGKWLELLIV